jgi:hypothetical protein
VDVVRPVPENGGFFNRMTLQGSILQNSVSAENVLDKYTSSNFGRISQQNNTCTYINLSEYCGQQFSDFKAFR